MKLILTLLLCFNLCLAQVDTKISIGKVDSLYSKILKENRELWVYLPDNFNASKKYPIVYLLDGKTNFHSFT
ncbi:MAG: alpha/beta hydrolase-fold protein, partial [Bacteroidia bacterium]